MPLFSPSSSSTNGTEKRAARSWLSRQALGSFSSSSSSPPPPSPWYSSPLYGEGVSDTPTCASSSFASELPTACRPRSATELEWPGCRVAGQPAWARVATGGSRAETCVSGGLGGLGREVHRPDLLPRIVRVAVRVLLVDAHEHGQALPHDTVERRVVQVLHAQAGDIDEASGGQAVPERPGRPWAGRHQAPPLPRPGAHAVATALLSGQGKPLRRRVGGRRALRARESRPRCGARMP